MKIKWNVSNPIWEQHGENGMESFYDVTKYFLIWKVNKYIYFWSFVF